ncbi:MAG: carbohydrate porin [Planctomycetes bacterium]|nr:carbohydrate porin [Planctomycetota bacterium]
MVRIFIISFSSFVLLAPALSSQDAAAAEVGREWIGGLPVHQWTRLTGDWSGHRTALEELGVEFGGGWTVDWSAAWSGGLRNRATVGSLLDVNLALDLETLAGLPRTMAFLDAYSIQGRDPSDDVGDMQGFSNIQAPDTDQLAEAWLETSIGEWLRIKIGKVDVNSEFSFVEEGGEFLGSPVGISPTVLGAPTYPDPSTSVNVFVMPGESSYVGFGVYDGAAIDGIRTGRQGFGGFFEDEQSDAYFFIGEAGFGWTGGQSWGSGRAAIGVWHHTGQFARFAGGNDSGTVGAYLVAEQRVWREHPESGEDLQGIGVFCRVGMADEDVAEVTRDLQIGATWTGLLEHRDDDIAGLMLSHLILNDDPGAGFGTDETSLEFFYRVQLTPAISIKPDLQYIMGPGGDPSVDDALVGALRVEIVF